MTDLFNQDTLADAIIEWQETIKHKGGICPCCHRFGKIYPRSINKTMAKSLVWLAGQSVDDWVSVPERAPRWLVRSNQLATLRWWGLVERNDETAGDNKHSGYWRATHKGRSFAEGHITVPKQVFTYAGNPTGFSLEHITISQVLPRFSYIEVMRGEPL